MVHHGHSVWIQSVHRLQLSCSAFLQRFRGLLLLSGIHATLWGSRQVTDARAQSLTHKEWQATVADQSHHYPRRSQHTWRNSDYRRKSFSFFLNYIVCVYFVLHICKIKISHEQISSVDSKKSSRDCRLIAQVPGVTNRAASPRVSSPLCFFYKVKMFFIQSLW